MTYGNHSASLLIVLLFLFFGVVVMLFFLDATHKIVALRVLLYQENIYMCNFRKFAKTMVEIWLIRSRVFSAWHTCFLLCCFSSVLP